MFVCKFARGKYVWCYVLAGNGEDGPSHAPETVSSEDPFSGSGHKFAPQGERAAH